MGIEFEFLKAGKGDCILISIDRGTKKEKNIVIDGGVSKTYKRTTSKTGTLKSRISKKVLSNLDLVVLTHIDDDHICGLIQLLKDSKHVGKIKELWFNSSCYLNEVDAVSSVEKGHGQLNYFQKIIDNQPHIKHRSDIFMENQKIYSDWGKDIEIILLSPYKKQLNNLDIAQKKWEKERIAKGKEISIPCRDESSMEKSSIDEEEYKVGETEKNASSIAFILRYKEKNFLFLADADINIINNSLKALDRKLLNFKFVKLSHHGSFKNNINEEFLQLIKTDTYIILTDGKHKRYNHPHKETIQLILDTKPKRQEIEFIFNYEKFYEEKFYGYSKEDYNYKANCKREIKW
jgi:beta-lactamase superfamily II metal-dependent hydrolase